MLLREHGKDEQAEAAIQGKLLELYLGNCQIADHGAEAVAEFLKRNETVIETTLCNCNISWRGAKAIADALELNETISYFHLAYNRIGDEVAEAFIEILRRNVCIQMLYLAGNDINPFLVTKIEYLTQERNQCLIPNAVRRICLFLISSRRTPNSAGDFAILPKEIVKMIAMEVWATNKDPVWLDALAESERMPK